MPPLVDIGTGTTIAFATSSFTAEIHGPIELSGFDREAIDVTHMGTTLTAGRIGGRRKILGRLAGTLEMVMNVHFKPDAAFPANRGEDITITFPNGEEWDFTGGIISYSVPVPLEDKMTASITVKALGLTIIS